MYLAGEFDYIRMMHLSHDVELTGYQQPDRLHNDPKRINLLQSVHGGCFDVQGVVVTVFPKLRDDQYHKQRCPNPKNLPDHLRFSQVPDIPVQNA